MAKCNFCGDNLKLLEKPISARCMVCGERSKTRTWCLNGHYVCDQCRSSEFMDLLAGLLRRPLTADPIELFLSLRAGQNFSMHGPEHHSLVAAAFLLAYHHRYSEPSWDQIIDTVQIAATKLPGGTCGFWGACAAALSVGMACSAILDSSPTAGPERAAAHKMVAAIVERMGDFAAPRCCRRECLLALAVACELSGQTLPHALATDISAHCDQADDNPECLGEECPFR